MRLLLDVDSIPRPLPPGQVSRPAPTNNCRNLTAARTAGGKESVVVRRRGVRVVRIHHLGDALYGEHLGGIGRPGDEHLELGAFAALELREHVIGEVAPRVTAPDPQPEPGKL